jgi:uncharacterized protein YbaR (Trm112 family)
MLDVELIKLLCCPETHQELIPADPEVLSRLNQQIAARTLRNRAGEAVVDPIEAGLMRADRKLLFLIRHDIPIMLMDQAIPLP